MNDKITAKMLKAQLVESSAAIQKLITSSDADESTKNLIDAVCQQQNYVFSYIIEYLEK